MILWFTYVQVGVAVLGGLGTVAMLAALPGL